MAKKAAAKRVRKTPVKVNAPRFTNTSEFEVWAKDTFGSDFFDSPTEYEIGLLEQDDADALVSLMKESVARNASHTALASGLQRTLGIPESRKVVPLTKQEVTAIWKEKDTRGLASTIRNLLEAVDYGKEGCGIAKYTAKIGKGDTAKMETVHLAGFLVKPESKPRNTDK